MRALAVRHASFAIASLLAALAVPAFAGTERVVAAGASMTVTLPDGWLVQHTPSPPRDEIFATPPDNSALLQVEVIADSAHTPVELARGYARDAHGAFVGAATPGRLGAHVGARYRLEVRGADGSVSATIDLTIARLSAASVGLVSLAMRAAGTPAQQSAASAVTRTVRVNP